MRYPVTRYISIHALVKRATNVTIQVSNDGIYFNPRPREEGDFLPLTKNDISGYFNPRPREEGDIYILFLLL